MLPEVLNHHLHPHLIDQACVWIQRLLNPASTIFYFFLFFFLLSRVYGGTDFTVQRQFLLFIYCFVTVYHCSNTVYTLKNIKNRSHDTIYTFKNYFATVFSVSATISSIQTDPSCPLYIFVSPLWVNGNYGILRGLLNFFFKKSQGPCVILGGLNFKC